MSTFVNDLKSLLAEAESPHLWIRSELAKGKRVEHKASGVHAYPRTGEGGKIRGYGVMKNGRKYEYGPDELDQAAEQAHRLTTSK